MGYGLTEQTFVVIVGVGYCVRPDIIVVIGSCVLWIFVGIKANHIITNVVNCKDKIIALSKFSY